MTARRVVLSVVGGAVLAVAAAQTASAACPDSPLVGWQSPDGVPGNRLFNPGAEGPTLTPWTAAGGGRIATYGADPSVPDAAFAAVRNHGVRLFASADQQTATFTQDLDVGDLAGRDIRFGGLGTSSSGAGDPGIVQVQAIDAHGMVLDQAEARSVMQGGSGGGVAAYRTVMGGMTVPTAALTLRVQASADPGPTAGAVTGLDGLYLTDNLNVGAVPAIVCAPPLPGPPVPGPQPAPPPNPKPKKPTRAHVVAYQRSTQAGKQIRVRLVNVARGQTLVARWARGGKHTASQRLTIRTGTVKLKAPRRTGRYRVELRYDAALIRRFTVRITSRLR